MSTEAGGAGLNLQVADTLINFELPWNPAKKNQRNGRIDRLGQTSKNLTIYNLITQNSIEQQIAAGLLVKQNLFEGVLDSGNKTDYVDFSSKGRSQFIDQLEAFLSTAENETGGTGASSIAYEEITEDEDDLNIISEAEKTGTDTGEPDNTAEKIPETNKEKTSQDRIVSGAEEIENVMASGMQFLSGLFKMSTGKDLGFENQKISIDKDTGEVTMTFKLPGF